MDQKSTKSFRSQRSVYAKMFGSRMLLRNKNSLDNAHSISSKLVVPGMAMVDNGGGGGNNELILPLESEEERNRKVPLNDLDYWPCCTAVCVRNSDRCGENFYASIIRGL